MRKYLYILYTYDTAPTECILYITVPMDMRAKVRTENIARRLSRRSNTTSMEFSAIRVMENYDVHKANSSKNINMSKFIFF